MKYPNQFHTGCSAVKACKFEKKLDFLGQIWFNSICCGSSICHSRGSGNPAFSLWTPAFAGVTSSVLYFPQQELNNSIEAYNCMLISGSERELIA